MSSDERICAVTPRTQRRYRRSMRLLYATVCINIKTVLSMTCDLLGFVEIEGIAMNIVADLGSFNGTSMGSLIKRKSIDFGKTHVHKLLHWKAYALDGSSALCFGDQAFTVEPVSDVSLTNIQKGEKRDLRYPADRDQIDWARETLESYACIRRRLETSGYTATNDDNDNRRLVSNAGPTQRSNDGNDDVDEQIDVGTDTSDVDMEDNEAMTRIWGTYFQNPADDRIGFPYGLIRHRFEL